MANILVIDDETSIRNYLRKVLVSAGHSVRDACDGRRGLAAIAEERPDLIICDLFMPGRDGIETMREVRRLAPAVPIVALSGGGSWGLFNALESAVALGATVGFPKPIEPAVLHQLLNELLSGGPPPPPCPNAPPGRPGTRLCPTLRWCPNIGTSVWCGARSSAHPEEKDTGGTLLSLRSPR